MHTQFMNHREARLAPVLVFNDAVLYTHVENGFASSYYNNQGSLGKICDQDSSKCCSKCHMYAINSVCTHKTTFLCHLL